MNETIFPASEGFNTVFNIIENCDIEAPSYETGFGTGKFIFKKRSGSSEVLDLSESAKSISSYSDLTTYKSLVLSETKLTAFTATTSETLISSTYSDMKMFDSEEILGLSGGTASDHLTATGGANTSGSTDGYLEDTTQSWTAEEYAGQYVWIVSGTGVGQIQMIKTNDATKLYVDSWLNSVAPSTDSEYVIFSEPISTPMFSSVSEGKTWFFDGNTLQYAPSLKSIRLMAQYDNRMWYVYDESPNLIYYTEIGQPLITESYIDTGLDDIIDISSFGDYLLIGKEKKIRLIRDINIEETAVYNTADLITGLGVLSEGSITVWKGGAYLVGDDKQLYTLSIESSSGDVLGSVSDISDTLGGYLDTFSYTSIFFLKRPQSLSLFLSDSENGVTRVCKYYQKYKGWTVDNFPFFINDYKFVGDSYYYTSSNSLLAPGGTTDLGETFEQRVGILFGLDDIFTLKNLYFLKFISEFNTSSVCRVYVEANGAYSRNVFKKDVDDSSLQSLGIGSEYASLGQNVMGLTSLGGDLDTSSFMSSLRIFRVAVARSGSFFQILMTDEHGGGFSLGDVAVYYSSVNPVIHGKTMSV